MDDERQGFCNFSNKTAIGINSPFTAPENGMIMAMMNQRDKNHILIQINEEYYINTDVGGSNITTWFIWTIPLKKNDVALFSGNEFCSGYFFPYA